MTIGAVKPFSTTVQSGATYSSYVDLAGGYKSVMLEIPTMASATDVRLVGSNSYNGIYRQIYLEPVAGTTTPPIFNIDSSVTNCLVPINISTQYVKVEFTSATTKTSQTFNFICNSN